MKQPLIIVLITFSFSTCLLAETKTTTWSTLHGGDARSCAGEQVQWIPASSGVPTTTLATNAPKPGCWIAKSANLKDWCFVSDLAGIALYATAETYGDTDIQKAEWGYGCRDEKLRTDQHHAIICTAGGQTNEACAAAAKALKR
jgi:hypothetical protein